jgi:hypothetical protein
MWRMPWNAHGSSGLRGPNWAPIAQKNVVALYNQDRILHDLFNALAEDMNQLAPR